jgi:signal transduction histidine kinase
MDRRRRPRLPLQQALEELDLWQARPTPGRLRRVTSALERLVVAYGTPGAYVDIDAPPLPRLTVGVGSMSELSPDTAGQVANEYGLHGGDGAVDLGSAWLPGDESAAIAAAHALELAFDAAWSRAEARAAGMRLAALDSAVRGIAGIRSVDSILQLIVDRVRELSAAEYAALGILGADGYLERFLTSGIDDELRARIGGLPRGRGLLGLIIREDQSFRIDDIATDPRRYGFPPNHPPMHSFLGVPIRSKGASVGNLYLTNKQGERVFSAADQRLVEMFALHAGIAIENARLHEQVARLAVVSERERIGQELHDGIIQSLYAVALSLEDVPDILAEDEAAGTARIDRAIDAIHQTNRDIRNYILGLEPELLEDADLLSGLRALAAEFRLTNVTDLEVDFDEPLPELGDGVAAHLLAMTREALSNISRHSHATRARLELRQRLNGEKDSTLRLIIGDNGIGFEPDVARTEEHHGLVNMKARAEGLGGSLVVRSEPGAGTRIEADVPAQPHHEQTGTATR